MKRQRKLRLGLLSKLILFLAVTLVPLAAITWWISVRALTTNLTDEFTSKGTAIARSLASSAVDLLLHRDASTVQGLVDQVGAINGVKYVMVYDQQKTLVAHTFAPLVPPGIVDRNLVPGDAAQQVREVARRDRAARDHLQRHHRAPARASSDRIRARRGAAQARGSPAQHHAVPRHRHRDRAGRPHPSRPGDLGRPRQRRRRDQRDGRGAGDPDRG